MCRLINYFAIFSLGIPIVMDQFAWTDEQALFYMGILMAVGAVISVVVIALLKLICN
jgi:MFS transporter, ceroid-lipofuscinosis neuronal protein 7